MRIELINDPIAKKPISASGKIGDVSMEDYRVLQKVSRCPTGDQNAGLFYENFLRYLAFAVRNQHGTHSASCLLEHINVPNWVKDSGSTKVGVGNEVEVYDALEGKYNLIPTLDNGFHFDFIGKDWNQVVLIDATTACEDKDRNNARIAHDEFARDARFYYASNAKGCVKLEDLLKGKSSVIKQPRKEDWDAKKAREYVTEFERSALLSALRNHCLWAEYEPREQTHFDKAVLKQMLTDRLLSCDDLRKLELDKIIYRYGREFANIAPTLAMDGFCDFVGIIKGKMCRIHSVVNVDDAKRFYDNPALMTLGEGMQDMVAYWDDKKRLRVKTLEQLCTERGWDIPLVENLP